MKTLIIIGYVWPEPNSSAAGSRMMQLIRAFQQDGYAVTFASPAEDSPHAPDLAQYDITAVRIALNCSSFDQWIAEQAPDVVMFDRFMMEEQFGWRVEEHCPTALRILDMEDVHCLRDARHRAVKRGQPWQADDIHHDLAYREIAAIARCDLTLVISEFEMQWLAETFPLPASQLVYCPFMVTPPDPARVLPLASRQQFVSIGNFRHAPNWDAVLTLREYWPAVRRRLPNAEVHVYGAYPPKKATQLHNEAIGFWIKGWAEDARAVVGEARALLAPLRFGAGLKGKLLEAAELGTPAVTTDIGAEGMYDASLPSPALIANDETSFVDALVSLSEQDDLWHTLSQSGPQQVAHRFNVANHATALITRVNNTRHALAAHRQSSFIGGMLRHHSMRSTKYMSQWIEAKNRSPDGER
ncbi:MAG: glycosyltransferase family 4 protein [Pseudomonadota bacterium]|nr:glycosyltransferase family 4 protein [Pseudomonadota bacterium]